MYTALRVVSHIDYRLVLLLFKQIAGYLFLGISAYLFNT